jgi:hypothetical protein
MGVGVVMAGPPQAARSKTRKQVDKETRSVRDKVTR